METTYEPPKCPCCGANLFTVWEKVYETYVFNPKTRTYSREPADAEVLCPDCHRKLWDVLPEGPCNYNAKRKRRKQEITNKASPLPPV